MIPIFRNVLLWKDIWVGSPSQVLYGCDAKIISTNSRFYDFNRINQIRRIMEKPHFGIAQSVCASLNRGY
jgi:Asp/Glu/hydantoin racemase